VHVSLLVVAHSLGALEGLIKIEPVETSNMALSFSFLMGSKFFCIVKEVLFV
jgi:hypothetical protein